jgi:hypothetical protein
MFCHRALDNGVITIDSDKYKFVVRTYRMSWRQPLVLREQCLESNDLEALEDELSFRRGVFENRTEPRPCAQLRS